MSSNETEIVFEDVIEYAVSDSGFSIFYFPSDGLWVAEKWDESEDSIILRDEKEGYDAWSATPEIDLYGIQMSKGDFDGIYRLLTDGTQTNETEVTE